MGKFSRQKGKRGELMAAKALDPIIPGLKRMYNQSRNGWEAPDVDVEGCPFWIEVKFTEKQNYKGYYKQALEASQVRDKRPVLLMYKRAFKPWTATFDPKTVNHLPEMRNILGQFPDRDKLDLLTIPLDLLLSFYVINDKPHQ